MERLSGFADFTPILRLLSMVRVSDMGSTGPASHRPAVTAMTVRSKCRGGGAPCS